MANAINWFEIPAKNLDRACKFYGSVLSSDIHREEIMGTRMGFLPHGQEGVGGALVEGEGYEPSDHGPLVYLNGGGDLAEPLARVESAGGSVIVPKTKISDEIGYFAIIRDTEGNKLALHSPA
ncbi:MAG: VOC family protein [Cyclobacteriaceae bacterium]|nr:VOC family protein [Cyclobacteriaceae bacterium]